MEMPASLQACVRLVRGPRQPQLRLRFVQLLLSEQQVGFAQRKRRQLLRARLHERGQQRGKAEHHRELALVVKELHRALAQVL